MILDLFAGPGGWDEGARSIGVHVDLGIEWDKHACATAEAAGFARLQADIAALNPLDVAPNGLTGLIASPPCQAWSMAGNRNGEHDRAACHELADRMALCDDSTDWTEWADPRSALVCQPVRWARDLKPEWIALEEVPAVLGLWEHFGRIFTSWGYHVWTGVLNAANYGVPQTRKRAFLIASRVQRVSPPMPTHSKHGDMFAEPWVSMAEALGWKGSLRHPHGKGMTERFGERDPREATEPGLTVTGKARSWVWERPAPTVVGTRRSSTGPLIGRQLGSNEARRDQGGHNGSVGLRDGQLEAVRVTIAEASVLQSFRPDYPWQGSRSKQFLQVGNAVPPLLAGHVLRAAGALAMEAAA